MDVYSLGKIAFVAMLGSVTLEVGWCWQVSSGTSRGQQECCTGWLVAVIAGGFLTNYTSEPMHSY